ncbi:MAG: DUF2516 family protein [Micromonosporaceae bacterium]|nr:DUF2516 family protein [Micromonosporaceae bacterium]
MAPHTSGPFAFQVEGWLRLVLAVAVLVVELVAFINCATQRADAFAAVGSLSKGAWLALTGGALLFTLLIGFFNILGIVAVAAALIYLLDLRPALRDAVDGPGPW